MATRRSRIKCIANIPQRRKAENKPADPPSVLPKLDTDTNTNSLITDISSSVTVSETPSSPEKVSENITITQQSADVSPQKCESNNVPENISASENTQVESTNESSKPAKSAAALPRRRTFIKPAVNAKLLSQRLKPKLDPIKLEEKAENVSIPDTLVETSLPAIPLDTNIQSDNSSGTQPARQVLSIQTKGVKSGSDTEYSAEPLSPTKLLNRSRIKAVPRLGQRRTSTTIHGSASESEDDTRKNFKRIRTESSCSTLSTSNEPQIRAEPGSPQKSKEFSTIIQRKCKRTEQSRKMAEARRHFLHKFGNKTPDKQKLTMIDLIFYNPNTNPMSQKPKKSQTKTREEVLPASPEKEENADHIQSDEENTVPAPQIKIGANGEIVVDEQSLIIENAQTKKDRDELQKSELVDGDFDTNYGIYKREKRSKDWSKEETLRFYKALNTLGTDFTLMVQLFAGRSRRELKMKFKKEERVNRPLVDKALTKPVEFNIRELQEEVENQKKKTEQEQANKAREAEEWENIKKDSVIPYSYSGIKRKPSSNKAPRKARQKKQQSKSPDIYSKLEKGITSIWGSESEDGSDSDSNEHGSLDNILKPTRCGRIPKPRRTFNSTTTYSPSLQRQEPQVANNVEDLCALQPGSLMIVGGQTPTGEPTFKVFMVTPSQNRVPITLTPDMLSNLTQSANNTQVEPLPPENNYTIVHDECDTTKSVDENSVPPKDNIIISTEAIEKEMCPYEQPNLSIPVETSDSLLDQDATLCSDGKYDMTFKTES